MHALREQGNIFSEVLRLAFARHNADDAASGALRDPSQDDRAQRRGHHEPPRNRRDEITTEAFEHGDERCGHEDASYRSAGPTRQR